MNSRRRNGKVPSCEPCRKDKVRCDHKRPICSRCQLRGIVDQCFYHPAPLTRRKERLPAPVADAIGPRCLTPSTPSSPGQLPHSDRRSFRSPTGPLQSGYLGPTSFVASFPGTELNSSLENGDICQAHMLHPFWTQMITEAFHYLDQWAAIEQLIREYYDASQSAIVPAPLILNTLRPIREMWETYTFSRDLNGDISGLVTRVIQNTTKPFNVSAALEGGAFHTLFTGDSTRLEILGILYGIAGLASLFGLATNRFAGLERSSRAGFAQKMLEATDVILQVCKMVTPVNDLTVWMLYENLLLTTLVLGDSSSNTWNRMGEVSTDIFLLGIHRDPGKGPSDLPLFLVECRRRFFAAAYQLDKSIATFLGRPPRLPWRHSDCKLPLDISDEALVYEKSLPGLAQNTLGIDGWDVNGVRQRASWVRVRFLISIFREEILDLSHQTPSLEMAEKLNDISRRCHSAWDSIPAHLRYTPQPWNDNLPLGESIMLIISYLAYHYNDFLIQRLLVQQDPDATSALLSVSSTILSAVLVLGAQREIVNGIYSDFTWTILLYGFPTASVLIRGLQNQTRSNEPFPYQGSRARLIRDLTVFISHLESVVKPGNVNFDLLNRASRAFSEILDEILEPKTASAHGDGEGEFLDPVWDLADVNLLDMDFGVMFDQWLV